jgi:hypothetical protein
MSNYIPENVLRDFPGLADTKANATIIESFIAEKFEGQFSKATVEIAIKSKRNYLSWNDGTETEIPLDPPPSEDTLRKASVSQIEFYQRRLLARENPQYAEVYNRG